MSAQAQEILSGTFTASAIGGPFQVAVGSMLAIDVHVTAGTAITRLDLRVQGSRASNGPWADVPADHVLKSVATTTGAANAVTANAANVIDNKSTTTAEDFLGIYKHFPMPYGRTVLVLNGTSVTLSAGMSAK